MLETLNSVGNHALLRKAHKYTNRNQDLHCHYSIMQVKIFTSLSWFISLSKFQNQTLGLKVLSFTVTLNGSHTTNCHVDMIIIKTWTEVTTKVSTLQTLRLTWSTTAPMGFQKSSRQGEKHVS